jgi:hypothetical protein
MNAGRPPSPRIEAADRVQNAFDRLEEKERHSRWKGVAWESRFSYSKIRKQVELDLLPRSGDNPKRRADRADQTTRNGLKWLTDVEHQYLVKEADGRYGKWSSVAGVLLDMERNLSDVRLVLEKISKEEPPWDPSIPGSWPPFVRQRHFAKTMLASAVVRAERALDQIKVDGWLEDPVGQIDIVKEIRTRRRLGPRRPLVLENVHLQFGTSVSAGQFWGPTAMTKPRFRRLTTAMRYTPERFEKEWVDIVGWRKAHPNAQRDLAELIRKNQFHPA